MTSKAIKAALGITMTTLEAARIYLNQGFSVIPLQPRGKRPVIPWKEYQERYATQEEIVEWFADGKNNIGIVTGKISGLAVVDFDTAEAINFAVGLNFPCTPNVRTGKGCHAYCLYREGVRNFQKRDDLPGIDLRGDGGYVAAPPSTHESGVVYSWNKGSALDDLALAELPEWVLATKPEHKATIADLSKGVEIGSRNDSLARVAGSFISKGNRLEDSIKLCSTWNLLNCNPPLSEQEVSTTVKSIYATHIRNTKEKTAYFESNEWPDPTPMSKGLSPVKPLVPDMIPAPLRGWLMDIADRMQIPPDFSTAAAVVALGAIIGRSCGIHPKRHDDWLVVPNLWGAVIGRPSLMKTPAVTEAQRHLNRLEVEAREKYQAAEHNSEIKKEIIKITKAAIAEEIKKAVKANNDQAIETARERLAGLQESEPTRRRYQTQDGTTEKIGELLNQNPRGLLVNRDELIGWFQSLDKTGREGDRAFYLEAWNGTKGYTYDRIGRGTLDIDALCVSIFGAITPGPLASYVYQTNRGGKGDDGLLQRFQVMVWPDAPNEWRNVDRFPDSTEKNRAFEIFKALSGIIPGAIKEMDADIPALRFSPDGQIFFDYWRQNLELRLRSDHGLSPAIESHLTKYRSFMPSLALIFHLVDMADGKAIGQVSEQAAVMASTWCDYLESHAGRVYGGSLAPGMESAREIIKHIRRGEVKDGDTVRSIYRGREWSRLTTPEEVRAGLGVLEEYDWLIVQRSVNDERGGRPSEHIRLNPKSFTNS